MQFDFTALKQKMIAERITLKELAQRINMKYTTLYSKIEGTSEFKQSEIVLICKELKIPAKDSGRYFSCAA